MIVRKLWLNHGKINGQPHRVRFASMSKLKSDLIVGLFGADCGPYMPAPLAPAVPLRSQRVEQSLGLIQIERVEALGEPAVDRSENAASRIPLALVVPEPRHAHRRTQLPGPCLLRARDPERALEIRFRFRRIGLGRQQRDFSGGSVDLRLPQLFLGCFHRGYRFANAAPSVLEISYVRIGPG